MKVITPFGRLVSPATSLFKPPPFGCVLLFAPDADLSQLEAAVRSVGGHALELPIAEDGWRRLELTTDRQPPVLDQSRLPVVAATEVSKGAWARALVRVTASGTIVLTALQLLPDWVRDLGDPRRTLDRLRHRDETAGQGIRDGRR